MAAIKDAEANVAKAQVSLGIRNFTAHPNLEFKRLDSNGETFEIVAFTCAIQLR